MLLLFSNFVRKFVVLGLLTQLSFASGRVRISGEMFRDFKTLMMYFNEPLLKTASLRDFETSGSTSNSFEGSHGGIMADKLCKTIEDLKTDGIITDSNTINFGENLSRGNQVMKKIKTTGSSISENEVEELQNALLEGLENTVVLPFGWVGTAPHAIALIVEKVGEGETFNLIVVNTGDGLGYHHAKKDPNKIYPSLEQLWLRFEGIPKEEIFSKNYWFMYPLIALQRRDINDAIETNAGSSMHYFYGSILNNFAKYLKVDKGDERLMSSQRSGSCTLSSLMAALLYSSDNLTNFYRNRVIIGQKMMVTFLESYKQNEDFLKLISDGFDLISRKLMRSTSSALAQQILWYLEAKYPSFQHASLIGSGRSNWIQEKKSIAIEALKLNPKDYDLIEESIKLASDVEKFIKTTPISSDSTKVEIKSRPSKSNSLNYNYGYFPAFYSKSAKNIRDFLNIAISRPKRKISNFSELKAELKKCDAVIKSANLICVKDVFEQCNVKDWWNYLNHSNLKDLIEFLDICKNIMVNYISITTVPNSLDDFVVLAHLQIAIWKSAVEYDNLADSIYKLDLANFNPPQILEEVIKQSSQSLTSTSFLNWRITTNFDADNLNKLNYLLKAYKNLKPGSQSEEFFGPSKLLQIGNSAVMTSVKYNDIMSTIKNKAAYEKMWNYFKDQIEREKQYQFDLSRQTNKKWLKDPHVTLTIFLSIFPVVERVFPQYVKMMDTLMLIYKRAANLPFSYNEPNRPHCFDLGDSDYVGLSFTFSPFPNFYFHFKNDWYSIENCYAIKRSRQSNIFYKLRHSQAQSFPENISRFEAWLNYVKGSPDVTIFNSPYFSYLTDHLLNFPNLLLDSSSGGVEINPKSLYPSNLKDKHIKEVYQALMRLIQFDLKVLDEKGKDLKIEVKSKLINRAVNIAIPLVKFIGRIDHDNLVHGNTGSEMLSHIYKKFYALSSYKNHYKLDEKQISQVNVLMAQICHVNIRNQKRFLELIQDLFPESHLFKSRKTLSRAHWFMARIHYSITELGKSHSDDLFQRGQIYHPVVKDECDDMSVILKSIFISKYLNDASSSVDIKYNEDGDIVRIEVDTLVPRKLKFVIGIQLSSGKIVENGSELVEKNRVINDPIFTHFFTDINDIKVAMQGEITKIGETIIYMISDFKYKGNVIAILCDESLYPRCWLYRKYEAGNEARYYLWRLSTTEYTAKLNYKWIYGYKLYEYGSTKLNTFEAILIKDDEHEPLNIIIGSADAKMNISSFTESNPVQLYEYNSEDYEKLDRHLKYFTDTGTILATTANDALVVIYPGLRFYNCPNYPIVLFEKEKQIQATDNVEFEVKNISGLIIESKQVAIHGVGIAGTLIARNKDGQRFILAPLSSKFDIKNDKFDKLRFVEKIPIVEDLPAPQTRLQRLLLSYYCIKASEFNYAKESLHPFTSINHNEPFTPKELEVIEWIVSLEDEGPEAEALKLMGWMHCFTNYRKFPTEYKEAKGTDLSEDSKNKTFRNLMKSEILKTIKDSVAFNYFKSIRDLPEKFHLHRIFPEFTSKESIKIFTSCLYSGTQRPPYVSGSFSSYIKPKPMINTCENLKPADFKTVSDTDALNVLLRLHKDPSNENLAKYLSLKSKLIFRTTRDNTNSRYNDYEAIIICAAIDSHIFEEAALALHNYNEETVTRSRWSYDRQVSTSRTYDWRDFNEKLKAAVMNCKARHGVVTNYFGLFDAAKGSKYTDPKDIFETLKADLKKTVAGSNELPSSFEFDLVEEEDFNVFREIVESLRQVLKPAKEKVDNIFTDANIGKSPVLQKLKGSIGTFVAEKGQYKETEIELSSDKELVQSFKAFRLYLENRIKLLNDASNEMVLELAEMIGVNQYANQFATVDRLMNHRKVKKFESLYYCYQKLSENCIQKKFPQLEKEKCKDLLLLSMKYYSIQVLTEFINSILESVERFLKLTLNGEKVTVDDLTLFLDEAGKIEDFNSRLRTPSILNFEYRSKRYRLRSEQVKDIENLSSVDKKTKLFKSVVIQRMMAAGKTLVLGTISVVKKALNPNQLSILVPPSSLYQSNLSAMQARTYSFFKSKGHNFLFPRFEFGSPSDISDVLIPFLDLLLEDIENIKKSRDYYVLSPDTLQSFLNSYIEVINLHAYKLKAKNTDQNIISALERYAKIYNIFRDQGSIILDEIDMTMDPKKELNFPTTENEPYNMTAVTLITDLVEFSVFDEKVTSLGLDILGNNQSGLTAENYERYRSLLFEYIANQFDDKNSLWSEILIDPNVQELNKVEIIDFLTTEDIEYKKSWIEKLHENDKAIIGNALVIIKLQLWKFLKEAIKATANLNFGATGPNRSETEYAIPYLAANTQSPSSEFSDRWETLNKTLLMLASVSCTKRIAKKMIEYVRKRIIDETSLRVKPKDTATYKNIQVLIKGIDPMSFDEEDPLCVNIMHDALKTRSPSAIRLLFSYAIDEIFSSMKFPVEQITSNALNMASMFSSVQGYSGTIDNVNILPREVVDGAYDNHMENEKNNGGISLKLIKDSIDPMTNAERHVHQLSDETFKESVVSIVERMIEHGIPNVDEQKDLSALIDTGAFFKNSKNCEVAKAILEVLKDRITVVLYYDEDSNQVKYRKRMDDTGFETGFISSTDPDTIFKATQTDISKRFTFYDQRHITGSDILQPKTARALMTIGTRVLLRDILQGTLRMRQFMTSQKVHLITSTSAANFYFSKSGETKNHVTASDMISLGAFNEDDKQLIENEKLAFAKIDNEVRRFVLEEITRAILNSKRASEIISIWFDLDSKGKKSVRDLFIRLIKENPLLWMVKMTKKDKSIVLNNYAEFWTQKLREASALIAKVDSDFDVTNIETTSGKKFGTLQALFKEMTTVKDDNKDLKYMRLLPGALNSQIADRVSDKEGGGEVEMQVFTQQLTELELDRLVLTVTTYPIQEDRKPFEIKSLVDNSKEAEIVPRGNEAYIRLKDILHDKSFPTEHKKMAASALLTTGKRLAVSKDLIKLVNVQPERPYRIFSEYTWEGSHILVQTIPGKKGVRAVLLSTESANEVREQIDASGTNFDDMTFWLCDLSGDIAATNDTKSTIYMNILTVMPDVRKLFFDLLIFNGSFNHIMSSELLKNIYKNTWLKSENYKYRAIFLLLRMRVLADKSKYIIAEDSMDLSILNRAARGDKEIISGMKMASGIYKKPPIEETVEASHFGKPP